MGIGLKENFYHSGDDPLKSVPSRSPRCGYGEKGYARCCIHDRHLSILYEVISPLFSSLFLLFFFLWFWSHFAFFVRDRRNFFRSTPRRIRCVRCSHAELWGFSQRSILLIFTRAITKKGLFLLQKKGSVSSIPLFFTTLFFPEKKSVQFLGDDS